MAKSSGTRPSGQARSSGRYPSQFHAMVGRAAEDPEYWAHLEGGSKQVRTRELEKALGRKPTDVDHERLERAIDAMKLMYDRVGPKPTAS